MYPTQYLRHAYTKKVSVADLQFKLTGSPVILFAKSLASAAQNAQRKGSLGRALVPRSYAPSNLLFEPGNVSLICVCTIILNHHLLLLVSNTHGQETAQSPSSQGACGVQ